MVAAGCRGDSAPTPTVASANFTPKATIEISDTGPLVVKIDDGSTTLESGTVMLVANTGHADHRLLGTLDSAQVFDTGTMQPGDETTVVLVPDGELHIADLTTDREVTVTVTPREAT